MGIGGGTFSFLLSMLQYFFLHDQIRVTVQHWLLVSFLRSIVKATITNRYGVRLVHQKAL